MARLNVSLAFAFAVLLSLSSFSLAQTCQQSCQATYNSRVASAEALAAAKGYYFGSSDNCINERAARAGDINPCVLALAGHPAVGISGCVDTCTTPAACDACNDQFQACCLAAAKDSYRLYLDDCLAGCGPLDKCSGKTCPSRCVGNSYYRGYCEAATGNCLEEEGYCANGCDGNACRKNPVNSQYATKDNVCEFVKGENCFNSPNDCVCLSGWKCKVSDPNRNDVGCVQVSSFSCNDNACEYQKGENCGSCGGSDSDCVCGKGKKCDAQNANSDTWGCVYTTKTGADPCANVQCDSHCKIDVDQQTGGIVSYVAGGQCVAGKCTSGRLDCPQYCQELVSGQAHCTDIAPVGTPPNCQVAGVIYGVTGRSVIMRVDENGNAVAITIKDGDTYCKGDRVLTSPAAKVFISSKDGTIIYVAPFSSYKNGKYQPGGGLPPNSDEIKVTGTVQIKQRVKKTYIVLVGGSDRIDMGEYIIGEDKAEKDRQNKELPDGYGTYYVSYFKDPGSNVIYEFTADGSERVTVLDGPDVEVIDPGTKESVSVPAGKRYSNSVMGSPGAGRSSAVDVSKIRDEIGLNPPPAGASSESCCGTSAILLLVPALFVLSRK